MKTRVPAGRFLFGPLLCVCLPMAGLAGVSPTFEPPLYVTFIDRLPAASDGPLDGLDKGQRAAAFRAALQSAGGAGKLPAVRLVREGEAVPPGATALRVRLRRWASIRPVGFTETDVVCRFDAEVGRDGRATVRLGSYGGIMNLDPSALNAVQDRRVVFEEAARRAIAEMAPALTR